MTCRKGRGCVTGIRWGRKSEVVLDIGNPVAYAAGLALRWENSDKNVARHNFSAIFYTELK